MERKGFFAKGCVHITNSKQRKHPSNAVGVCQAPRGQPSLHRLIHFACVLSTKQLRLSKSGSNSSPRAGYAAAANT